MLWNPAFIGMAGSRADISSALPSIASPVWTVDTALPGTMFTDTAGTAQASTSGALIARVANGLGGASYFQQVTSGARPSLILNALGTRSALRFDGTKYMAMAGVANPGTLFQSLTFTMAMAVRVSGRPQWAAHFAAGNNDGGSGGGGFDTLLIEANSNGWPRVFRAGGSDNQQTAPSNAVYGSDGAIWKTVVRSAPATGIELRTKSASGSFTGTGPLPSSADSFTWDTCYLGAEMGQAGTPGPAWMFQGDWFEFRFWNARATDAQFTNLQGYLDLKFGA